MEPLILVVDDEKSIRNFLQVSIETQGYKCVDTDNGSSALMLAVSRCPDIIILDLGLPDIDGLEVIKKLRAFSQVPIIVISARGHDREKVEALDAGADDYLTKPFSVLELLARIRVILRHNSLNEAPAEAEDLIYKIKNLVIDTDKRRIWLDNEEVRLTPNEYKVLMLLAKNRGKVLTHKFITKDIWGGILAEDIQSLRVCMGNLRRKLGEDPSQPKYIITEIGVGYRLVDE
ncbi:DNA-binding response regulator [Anaerosacchariphilus polymeriproducens]|uniref:Stage 0 sporulation protein A homolog n=2 Tax=Anaerosacchariphilus polymeriproducens TaxID=1812858 RepID=A0A371AYV3_9FIRM|nr:response regulator transcription factor [Anaerosacchariphilus polymeriproducens]RDU24729.1 DNA-binding response regulator [Anaerosacchariphilus polymeriproducens]